MKRIILYMLVVVSLLTMLSCTQGGGAVKKLQISLDFKRFPKQYTCDGMDISPKITIRGIPENTKSLAIIMDDPDAPVGTWVHWVAWNITPVSTIPENIPKTRIVEKDGIRMQQGINDFRKVGYGGPCPPKGHGEHHYHIKVYALDTTLNLSGNVTKKVLEQAMKGHIIASGEAIATYSR